MKDNDKTQPPVIEQVKAYLSSCFKLAKYEAVMRAAEVAGEFIADFMQGVSALFVLVFVSFTLAFYLAHIIHSLWAGFGLVSALYLSLFFALRIFKKRVEQYFIDVVVRRLGRHRSAK
jgi:hypothetical protein